MSAPLYAEPVIGYRSWHINADTYDLYARICRVPWSSDDRMEAACRPPHFYTKKSREGVVLETPHESPHEDCVCGLYAFHELYDALDSYSSGDRTIVGAGVFWGNIMVHTSGFRAQYGRVVALSEHRKRDKPGDLGWPVLVEGVVEKYNVPVVPLKLLPSYAETFGRSLGSDYLDP